VRFVWPLFCCYDSTTMRFSVLIALPLSCFATMMDFKYDVCEDYCLGQNPYSFTFTKMACPAGGARAQDGGFLDDECDGDDLTITYTNKKGRQVSRQTSLDEAMRVCGDEKIVDLGNGQIWLSPEYKFQQTVIECRDGHGQGQGWDGGNGLNPDATFDDISYTDCVQAAYDECLALNEEQAQCTDPDYADNLSFLCAVCIDCPDDPTDPLATYPNKATCSEGIEQFREAQQSCFDDENLRGYRGCIRQAQNVYELEMKERDQICEKTFILERASLPCSDTGGFGYVSCCCMVKGNMIEHPLDPNCQNQRPWTQCHEWKGEGHCDPNSQHFAYMMENCAFTCGVCGPVADSRCEDDSDDDSQADGHSDECTCADEMMAEMSRISGMGEYEAMALSTVDGALCESMSGRYRNGACTPESKNKVKCPNASDNLPLCLALGCEVTLRYGDVLECSGKPLALDEED